MHYNYIIIFTLQAPFGLAQVYLQTSEIFHKHVCIALNIEKKNTFKLILQLQIIMLSFQEKKDRFVGVSKTLIQNTSLGGLILRKNVILSIAKKFDQHLRLQIDRNLKRHQATETEEFKVYRTLIHIVKATAAFTSCSLDCRWKSLAGHKGHPHR